VKQEEQKLGAGGKSDRRKREMLFLIKMKGKSNTKPSTLNLNRELQLRHFCFNIFEKMKKELDNIHVKLFLFRFVLDYLLFSLHIVNEQNVRLSKRRRKNGDSLSMEVLLIHEITTQILHSITALHY